MNPVLSSVNYRKLLLSLTPDFRDYLGDVSGATAFRTIPTCGRRLCGTGGRSAYTSHLCCHPASGTVDTVDHTFDQDISIKTWPVRGRLRERAKSYAKALANDILR